MNTPVPPRAILFSLREGGCALWPGETLPLVALSA